MKYMDEYGYGIYPYVPEERDRARFAFERPEAISPDQAVWKPKAPYQELLQEKNLGRTKNMGQGRDKVQPGLPADPFPYSYPQNRDLAVEMIREALLGEAEDKAFYQQIIKSAPTQEDRELLTGIRKDEMKHAELLRKLFFELTGEMLKSPVPYENATRMTYCQALKKALLGEVAAVSKYRKILYAMRERRHINMLTEILTDEIRHADLYGLMVAMNGCYPKKETDKNIF